MKTEMPTFTTKDLLNQEHALPPRLEDLILAELFLAGGPCYIHRLWAEMFERQKSISAGSLLFTQEVLQLERQGLLKEAGQNQTVITKQGEVHLFGLVLLGMIPAAQARRLEAKGVLGVAKQLTKAVNHEGRSAEVVGVKPGAGCGEKSPVENNSNTQLLRKNSNPLSGGGASPLFSSPPFPSDDRFADNIARAIDKFLDARDVAEQERLEEIEAERESSGGIFGTGDPYEMEHNQHGSGCR